MKTRGEPSGRMIGPAWLNLAGFVFCCLLVVALVLLFVLNLLRHVLDWSFLIYFVGAILAARVFWARFRSAREVRSADST